MHTRREALRLLSSATIGALLGGASFAGKRADRASSVLADTSVANGDGKIPPLAPGAPMSAERMALIEKFKIQSECLEKMFEAGIHKSDFVMPYRLFRPDSTKKLPLVVYLHGSGGLGDDNKKQLELGNIFGTRVWVLPENQKRFPCYVLAPQTDRGWIKYDLTQNAEGPAKILPGLGDGNRLVLEIIDELRSKLAIDETRIYVTGQSMGGAGVWNIISQGPALFGAAAVCCGSLSTDDGTGSIDMPLWAFHGEADKTVPVSASRDRIEARKNAGGKPLYTEYAGVDHNVWQWAYTEPQLLTWMFSQQRKS